MSLRTSQKSDRVLVIRASAGTGKTFQLTNRLLKLLLSGAQPNSILATTFTRKAAGEILDRVLERLAKATASDAAAKRLADELGGDAKLTRKKAIELLATLLRRIDQLRISTLDAYFQKAAQSYALELGLPFGWGVLDEDQEEAVQTEAIRRVLRESPPSDVVHLMHLLDKGSTSWKVASQIRATVNATRSVFLRCAEGAWKKIEPRKGFSEEELAEALEQLEQLEPPKKGGKSRAKGKEGQPAEEDQRFRSALEASIAAARRGAYEYFLEKGIGQKILNGETRYYNVDIPETWLNVFQRWVEHARADFLKWLAIKNETTADLLAKFETQLLIAKRRRRRYTFDDIPRRLAETLQSEESHSRLSFRLDAGVEHLLLDEFQDTSPEQWRVLAPTARRVCASEKGAFLCVGDVKQAIYSWRGGSSRIFAAIEAELPNTHVEHLVQSYRSSPPVIAAVNRVMEKLGDFAGKSKDAAGIKAWAADFQTHATAKTDLPGYVTMREAAVPQSETGDASTEKGLRLLATLDAAADLVEETLKLRPNGVIAILLRRNEPIGRMVHLLRQRGIEASEEGGSLLLDSAAVEMVMSLLQLADHPGDRVARFHLETGPLGNELCEALANPAEFAATLRRNLVERGYGAFMREWAKRLAPFCDRRDAMRLQQLVELATEYDADATLRPSDFAKFIAKKKVADAAAAQVRVMTIHQSKGLEFETVILPELEVMLQGRNPQCIAGGDHFLEPATRATRYVGETHRALLPEAMQKDHEEERSQRVQDSLCLLYVAMTRAVHALHMIVPPRKSDSNSKWSDLLRFALCDPEKKYEDGLLYAEGDPNWHRRAASEASHARDRAAPEAEWPKITFAAPKKRTARNLARRRPSQVTQAPMFEPYAAFRASSSEATRYGAAVHYWFEQIIWGTPQSDGANAMQELASRSIALPTDDVSTWRKRFEAYCERPAVKELLDEEAFRKRFGATETLKVENEKPLVYLEESSLISGQIDRFVLELKDNRPVRAWIIDFKTDALRGGAAEQAERIAHHTPQLAAYRRGVAQTYRLPLSAVEAYLVLLEAGVVAPIDSAALLHSTGSTP